jgi:AraC-like DNA-binding protein/mannose-6-phosphate isomerase-like protein (cupin superfamily)
MRRADQAKRPCPMWLLPGMLQAMSVYVWQQELDPGFPLAVLEYAVHGDGDPMHWHDHLEIALVLHGQGGFELGGRRLPAQPGDVFFIDDSQPHVARAEPGADLRLLLVLFRPELIAGPGCREFDLGYLAAFRPDDPTVTPRIAGSSPLSAQIWPVLSELQRLCDRADRREQQLVDATLRRALALVNRDRGANEAAAGGSAAARRQLIRPVLAYIDRHGGEPITLEQVAAVAHVSPSRIRHVFKEVTGLGFKDYVTHVRMAEAKRLLLSTELSVEEVAHAVSYTNLSQFYKVFDRSCSMSPATYRRYYTPASGDRGGAQAL